MEQVRVLAVPRRGPTEVPQHGLRACGSPGQDGSWDARRPRGHTGPGHAGSTEGQEEAKQKRRVRWGEDSEEPGQEPPRRGADEGGGPGLLRFLAWCQHIVGAHKRHGGQLENGGQ